MVCSTGNGLKEVGYKENTTMLESGMPYIHMLLRCLPDDSQYCVIYEFTARSVEGEFAAEHKVRYLGSQVRHCVPLP